MRSERHKNVKCSEPGSRKRNLQISLDRAWLRPLLLGRDREAEFLLLSEETGPRPVLDVFEDVGETVGGSFKDASSASREETEQLAN